MLNQIKLDQLLKILNNASIGVEIRGCFYNIINLDAQMKLVIDLIKLYNIKMIILNLIRKFIGVGIIFVDKLKV